MPEHGSEPLFKSSRQTHGVTRTRLVVFYLTGSSFDGQWREIDLDQPPLRPARFDGPTVTCVATGNLEWRDDGACAEVWVPEDRLAEWRAEHDVE